MNRTRQHHRAAGVTLIEVLVATMILAVGLLGLAALLGNTMQSNQHASARTQAVFLASDMMDRMRANTDDLENYDSVQGDRTCNREWAYDDSQSVTDNDLDEWYSQVRCYLPDGNGSVSVDERQVEVRITWVDVESEDSQTEAVSLSSEL